MTETHRSTKTESVEPQRKQGKTTENIATAQRSCIQRETERRIHEEGKRQGERTKVRWLRFRAGSGTGLSLPYIRTINEAFSRP